ncbi:MAG: DUF4351 domain-containing protein [Proteobacteria bacterium]|nr:DUF4351 domain-containing protein [Pseudomonadota bacterium]
MNTPGYEFKNEFLRRYVAEGLAENREEARKEGRVDVILKQLTVRFGPLPEEIQTRVRGSQDAELDRLAERILTAQTLEQALGVPY